MSFSAYKTRLTLTGHTGQERAINHLHRDILNLLPDNPSYKTVLLNGEERKLNINSSLDAKIKKVTALPHESLGVGNHIVYCEKDYYVTECSVDDGVYAFGEMTLCNEVLRFISRFDGSIREYPAIITNTTKFNTGETPNKRLTLPSGQYSMLIPKDEHTILIDNEARFLIDKRLDYPSAYRVTYVDTSSYGYDDCLLNVILLQCELNLHTDNIELMIADYHVEEPAGGTIAFEDSSPFIRVGGTAKRFSPTVSDESLLPLHFEVDVDERIAPYVSYSVDDSSITFTAKNESKIIGSFITLTVSDAENNNSTTTLIQLKGLV